MIQEDDVAPNDSTYFTVAEPAEQTVARKKEIAQTLEALPILKTIIDHLDTQIDFLGSVDAMPADAKKDPIQFMYVHNSNEMARKVLQREREYIQGLLDTNARGL